MRHGETFANFERIIQGHQGGELTDKGNEQAKKIGMRLQDESFDLVCVSDLNRTRQTWQNISLMQGHRHKEEDGKVRFDSRLREKGGGVLEGSPLNTFKQQAARAGIELRMYSPEGGERWHDVMLRARDFLTEVTDELLPKKRENRAGV